MSKYLRCFSFPGLRTALASLLLIAASNLASGDNGRCDRLFKDQQKNATCQTLHRPKDLPVTDSELLGEVNKDQCGRAFATPYERDVCRWHQALTSRRRSDPDLRAAIAEQLRRMEIDLDLKESVVGAINRMRTNEVHDRLYARELEEQRAKRHREGMAEMAEEERKAEQRARAQAAKLDAALKTGEVGFLLLRWKLSKLSTVLISDIWLQNNRQVDAGNFTVTCYTFDHSGTRLSTISGTVYSRLSPGERRAFGLNMGVVHPESAAASCRLVRWR